MGRDYNATQEERDVIVSIHAPAWDATLAAIEEQKKTIVSIHAPAWDATI